MLSPKGTWCSPAPQPLNPWQFPEECTEVGGGRCGIPASSSADNVPTIHPFLFFCASVPSSCGCHRESKCLLAPCSYSGSQREPQGPGEKGLSRALSCSYLPSSLAKASALPLEVEALSTGQVHPSFCRMRCRLLGSTRACQTCLILGE